MALLDHFRPPLFPARHWESFHTRWISSIADALNRLLPADHFAEAQVHVGPRVEVDVATFQTPSDSNGGGGLATLTKKQKKIIPADLTLDLTYLDAMAVDVYETSGGYKHVASVELVSPANKDRPEERQAFATKCAYYLHEGCGLIVVDTVTTRRSLPLEDLFPLISPDKKPPKAGPLTAVSYLPMMKDQKGSVELRFRTFELGGKLPVLPLSLNAGLWVPVDLNATYMEAVSHSRLNVSRAS